MLHILKQVNLLNVLYYVFAESWVPAVCQVVPAVSLSLSSRTTLVMPCLHKWYSVWHPRLPPPITTASADLGTGLEGPV